MNGRGVWSLQCGVLAMCAVGCLRADVISLKTDYASCSIETEGARVLSFKGADGVEALWSPGSAEADARWVHGGVAVCWPWYGVNGRGDFHGTAWKSPFSIVSRSERKDRCELVLTRDEGAVRLEYTLVLRDTLKLELKTINNGKSDFLFSAALHPYFRVGERDRTEIGGVTGKPIAVTRAMDESYVARPGSCSVYRLHDHAIDRSFYLFFENSTDMNIWNPGEAKDCPGFIPGDDWRRFVCVEPALGDVSKPIRLRSGESVSLMMGIDVRRGSKTSGFVGKDPRCPTVADEPTGRPFHVLYLGAHPDDGDYDFASQFVKLVRAGAKVTSVAFCNGCKGHVEMGPEELAARRLKEAQSAAKVYGLERYIVLECPDCELDATREWRERIGRLIRDIAPDMIITHRTVDYHSDHRAVGQIVMDCCYFLGVPHWCPDTPVPENIPFAMNAVDTFTSPRLLRPDLVMSAAGALEEGARGLACHVSQLFEWMPPEEGDNPADLVTPDSRMAYARKLLKGYYAAYGKPHADLVEKLYGNRDEPVSYAELSEYSRAPSVREISFLESIPGFKWAGQRSLEIVH